MEEKCCLVFDVGKTNQKYFVFNSENQILKREKVTIAKVTDEDGHEEEDIYGIISWLKESFDLIIGSNKFVLSIPKLEEYCFSLDTIFCQRTRLLPCEGGNNSYSS